MVHSRNTSLDEGPTAQQELLGALSALHIGGKYSDLTITCNYRQWAVHKAIICSRSGFFDGAFSHPFRESKSGVIDLSEDDENAVDQMIQYFYYLDYLNEEPNQSPSTMFRHRAYSNNRGKPPNKIDLSCVEDPLLAQAGLFAQQECTSPSDSLRSKNLRSPSEQSYHSPTACAGTSSVDLESDSDIGMEDAQNELEVDGFASTESESHLLLHTQVYALAEKYDIVSLKQLARRKFEMAMACYYDSPEFADAIEEVYCSTVDSDRGLRDIVLQAFRTHPQLANTQDVFTVIRNTPSLAMELWKLERGIPI